jgi:GTP-binding protein Era
MLSTIQISRRLLAQRMQQHSRPFSTNDIADDDAPKRRLDVAIVGTPNAGKSQLLNKMTQTTVAAVSRKRHTTRGGILGARTFNNECQLIFWDTPGYLRANSARKEGLDKDLMVAATSEMEDVDYSLLVVDAARKLTDDYKETMIALMMHGLFESEGREEAAISIDEDGKEFVPERPVERLGIIFNKVDLVTPKTDLLEMAEVMGSAAEVCIEYYLQEYNEEEEGVPPPTLEELFPPMFYTNALTGEGTDDILNHLQRLATPCLEWPVDASESTLMSPVERVEEVIREKIYRTLHKEVPHLVRQVNRVFVERPGGIIEIQQDIVVTSKSHYAIVSGRNLSTIQQMAQRDLQMSIFPDKKVILHLHLKHNKSQHMDRNSRADTQGTVEYRRSRR